MFCYLFIYVVAGPALERQRLGVLGAVKRPPWDLSDRDLTLAFADCAARERGALASLLEHLGDYDARGLGSPTAGTCECRYAARRRNSTLTAS
ncbi:MAG: hypothetical protein IV100_09980 [Myxococcales bacterium]|nr:hypothetical protein [Myxococcales bacterium]